MKLKISISQVLFFPVAIGFMLNNPMVLWRLGCTMKLGTQWGYVSLAGALSKATHGSFIFHRVCMGVCVCASAPRGPFLKSRDPHLAPGGTNI